VENAVRQSRRRLAGSRDVGARLYQEAHDELVAREQLDVVPILDLYVELEQELERTTFKSMTLADRIRNRLEVRRRVFGDDLTNLLFSRDEAIDRYDIDRLALEADQELSPAQKARRLRVRRDALKVELAKQGIYVGFPDEAPQARRRLARGTVAGEAVVPAEDAGPEDVQ
jgi:lipase chaperone LimK